MLKTLALGIFALTVAAPALAQATPEEPKKCCCDKDERAKTDHGSMGHDMSKMTPATPK